MKSILKIKDHFLNKGITNSYLAEKAGITPAELYELDEKNLLSKKALIERVAEIIEVNPVDLSGCSSSKKLQNQNLSSQKRKNTVQTIWTNFTPNL